MIFLQLDFPTARSIPINVNAPNPTTLVVNYIQPTGTYNSYDVTLLDIVGQPVQSGTIGPNQVQADGSYSYIFNGVQPNTNYQVVVTGQTPEGPLDLGRVNTQTPSECPFKNVVNTQVFKTHVQRLYTSLWKYFPENGEKMQLLPLASQTFGIT